MNAQENTRISLIKTITRVVREATGLHERFSCEIANSIVDELSKTHGCSELYIPALPKEARRAQVLADYDGRNASDVCYKHGISKSTLYNYLRESNDWRGVK